MKGIAVIVLLATFIMLVIHVIKTDIPIEEMERIEKQSFEFARYCNANKYKPEECR